MKKFEKTILKDLYESVDGLFAFSLYSRYRVEPEDLFLFIQKYEEQGVLVFKKNKLFLTENGIKKILKRKIILERSKGRFSNIPKEYLKEPFEINSPYLPNLKTISKEILER